MLPKKKRERFEDWLMLEKRCSKILPAIEAFWNEVASAVGLTKPTPPNKPTSCAKRGH
jgi:hypothetical protein